MNEINFWKTWTNEYNRTIQFVGALAIVSAALLLITSWRSPAPTVTWQYLEESEVLEQPIHQFQVGPFALQTVADNTVIFEKLLGNNFLLQEWPAYFYLVSTLVGFILLLSIHSIVSRFWYMIGAGMLLFMISGLQLELLGVMGMENQYPAAFIMLAIIGPGVAFQYYFQSASFASRLITFSIAVIGSFGLLAAFAQVPKPIYFIAISFIPATIIASALLAVFTAHEIIATIIHLLTKGLKISKSFGHIVILSTIYLANLTATYLNDQTFLKWDYSLNPVLLLIVSGVLGIWGIRRQQEQMESFLLDGPFGPLAIIAFCVIAFGSSAFFYQTGNDAAIETIRNMSLYAHIGYGLMFLLYVVSNFGALLSENYAITKVLYKPKTMPYFSYRLAGSIVILGLVLYNYWQVPVDDTKGARHAAMGDYYVFTGNIDMAKGYYETSNKKAYHNYHANFVLANIENYKGNTTKERQYYLNAAERRPTEQAYMNAANTLDQNAVTQYAYMREVLKDFPRSGAANNAMGLAYSKFNQPDSAILFFNLARKDRITRGTAQINLLATSIKHKLNINVDSVYETIDKEDLGATANAFALANSVNKKLSYTLDLDADTVLNLFSASLISNYLINQSDSLEESFISKAEELGRKKTNNDYTKGVLMACAHAYYKNGLIDRAFKLMQEVTLLNENLQGKNNNTMALWAIENQVPNVALQYIQYAVDQNFEGALLTNAIALTEAGRNVEAIMLLDSLKKKSSAFQRTAESIIRILGVDKKLVNKLSDLEKYAYCRYRLGYADSLEFEKVAASIEDPDWHGRAILDRSKKLFALDDRTGAIRVYNMLNGIAMSDSKLFENIQQHELLMAAANGNIDFVKSKIKSGMQWPRHRMAEKIYYDGLIANSSADSASAKSKFQWLSKNNSYFEDGVLASANYFKQHSKDKLQAYTILATALQNNPASVRLLRAYVAEANRQGFDEYANDALFTLQGILKQK